MGGNIEGAPGGFCMIGDNMGKKFAEQICNNKSNVIQLQTSWLSVGHVDELFKIIPTQFNDGRPKECEFSLMSASPKKALELMKNPKRGETSFTNINNPDSDPNEMRSSRSKLSNGGNIFLCYYIKKVMSKKPTGTKISPAVKSVLLKLLFNNKAFAMDEDMEKYFIKLSDDQREYAALQ